MSILSKTDSKSVSKPYSPRFFVFADLILHIGPGKSRRSQFGSPFGQYRPRRRAANVGIWPTDGVKSQQTIGSSSGNIWDLVFCLRFLGIRYCVMVISWVKSFHKAKGRESTWIKPFAGDMFSTQIPDHVLIRLIPISEMIKTINII